MTLRGSRTRRSRATRGALLLLLAASALAAACGGGSATTDAYGEQGAVETLATSVTVEMRNLQFAPQGIRIKPGTTVRWVNQDPVLHNVSQIESAFLSQDEMPPAADFSFEFTQPGVYRYQCTFHHPNMNGVVIVEAA